MVPRRPRIYVDTSVIGGCLDEEFAEHSRKLLGIFRRGDAVILVSELTTAELKKAPPEVRAILDLVPEGCREYVEISEEMRELAEQYIAAGVVSEAKRVDAGHIAAATLSGADVLVSWNFRHIVSLPRIRGFNSVNLRLGYRMIEIRSPREVVGHENKEGI